MRPPNLKLSLALILISLLLLPGFACPAIQANARDTSAALQGALTAAQTQYQAQCTVPTGAPASTALPCTTITKAIAGQNALITATEAYCGWNPLSPPTNPATAVCTPVKGAAAGLQTAIANANLFVTELKGIIQ